MQHLPPETWRWDAVDVARAIRLGALSAREATEAALARLAAVNPAINAVVTRCRTSPWPPADAADAARARGDALGPLHGVPITVKVNADMAGRATTNGVVAFRERSRRRTARSSATCGTPAPSSSAGPTPRPSPGAGSPTTTCTEGR